MASSGDWKTTFCSWKNLVWPILRQKKLLFLEVSKNGGNPKSSIYRWEFNEKNPQKRLLW
jgi:hypothetical protein